MIEKTLVKKSDLLANNLTVGEKPCLQWSGVVQCSREALIQGGDITAKECFHQMMCCHKTQCCLYEQQFIIKSNGCIKYLNHVLILKWVMNKYMGRYVQLWEGMFSSTTVL